MIKKEIILMIAFLFLLLIVNSVFASPIIEGHEVAECTLSSDITSQIVSINNQIQEIRDRISNYELNADAQSFFDKVSANEKQISGLTDGCEEMKKACES
jgi:hypothetical protein